MGRKHVLQVIPAVLLILSGLLAAAQTSPPQDFSAIQHFVFIFKENRSFDNYFGAFPGADGATSGAISTGEVIPLSHMADVAARDVRHLWISSHLGVDNGRMDGFDLIDLGQGKPCNVNGDYLCYSQLLEQDIPNYFTYARNFVLADQTFSSISSASFPNHLYSVAAQAGGATQNPNSANSIWGCDSAQGVTVPVLDEQGRLSNVYPCFDFPTLADSLENAGLSWMYYAPSASQSGYEWSALDAIRHIRETSLWGKHVVPFNRFVNDALNGNLPAVSWLVPDTANSEHPPSSACQGENWTVSQINAVMQGPDWDSTLIVVVWDDFGGLYDHVPPPELDQFGLGIRVPMLIISPFSKPGFISHTQYEFSSLLKLVEERFNLAPLTERDSSANDLQDSLDFTQKPLPPLILSPRQCPVLSTAEMDFRAQRVGTPSPVQTATVSNFGTTNLSVSSVSTSGDFTQTNNCGVLSPGSKCKISLTFTPKATGLRSGSLTVRDSDPSSPQVADLSGVGTSVTLSPTLLSFPITVVGNTSSSKGATLTNNSSSSLNISNIQASGDYSESDDCGNRLPPGGNCNISVRFSPGTPGMRSGTITINDSDGGSPQVLKLSGEGSLVVVSPNSLNFGNVRIGRASQPQPFTLTNKGSNTLAISGVEVQDTAFHKMFDYSQTNNCGNSLPPGGSCDFSVTFTPSIQGTEIGVLLIFDSESATSPQSVGLSGTGQKQHGH